MRFNINLINEYLAYIFIASLWATGLQAFEGVTYFRLIGIVIFLFWIIQKMGLTAIRAKPPLMYISRKTIKLYLTISIFLFIILLSITFNDLPTISNMQTPLMFAGMVLILSDILNSTKKLHRAAKILYLSGTAIAIVLIYQYFTGISFLGITPHMAKGYFRTIGISQNVNNVALNLAIVLPLGFFLYEESKSFPKKIMEIISMIIILSAVLTTYSRGAMITLLVISIYKILSISKIHQKVAAISVAVLSLALLSLILPTGSFLNRFMETPKFLRLFSSDWSQLYLSKEFGSIWGRYQASLAGIEMFVRNPLIGVGHGNFANSVPFYSNISTNRAAHNMYISIFAETGIFGGLSFLGIWYLTLSNLNSSSFQKTEDVFFLNVKTGLIGFLVGGLFLSAQYYEIAWLYVAFSIAGYELYRKKVSEDNE